MDDYELGIEKLKQAQKKQLVQSLDDKKNSSLATLNTEEQVAKPVYTQQRNDANSNSQIQKLNFAEFYNNRGQANAGVTNQAEMSRENMLNRNVGAINTSETTQMNDIARRKSDVSLGYNSDVAIGNMSIDTDIATKLLAYKEQKRQEKLAQDEQLRREKVAADENTLTFQRSMTKAGSTTPAWTDENEDGIDDSKQVETKNSFADDYATSLINNAKQSGSKYSPMQISRQLNTLKQNGQITSAELGAIISELQSQGLLG